MLMVNNTEEKCDANFKKSKTFSKKVIGSLKAAKLITVYFEAINGGLPLH